MLFDFGSEPMLPARMSYVVWICAVNIMRACGCVFPSSEKCLAAVVQTHGGGNAANALTSAARLGLSSPVLITKLGKDGVGEQILGELEGDGVDIGHILQTPDAPSPFSYIIVDREGEAIDSDAIKHL